jgi:Fe2+ transport system protein FeoA
MSSLRFLEMSSIRMSMRVEITAGLESRKKLLALGIHVGDFISKINLTRWSPVLIRNLTTHSSKIAIGHGLARKIMVGDEPL